MKRLCAAVAMLTVIVAVAMFPLFGALPNGLQLVLLSLQRETGLWLQGSPAPPKPKSIKAAAAAARNIFRSLPRPWAQTDTGLIIYGPHHSGTKFVSHLFAKHLCVRDINTDAATPPDVPAGFLREHYAGREQHVPWKHTIHTRRNPYQEARHNGVLYVCLVRSLNEWLSATYEEPHEMNKELQRARQSQVHYSQEKFLSCKTRLFDNRIHKLSHMVELDPVARNPLQQRAMRLGHMHNLLQSGANVVLINLKHLQRHPQQVLTAVSSHFDIPQREVDYEPVPYMTTRESHREFKGLRYDPNNQKSTSWDKLCAQTLDYDPAMEAFIDTLTLRLSTKTARRIPRRIVQTWKSRTLTGTMLSAAQSWRDLNPNYEYEFFDDDDIEVFMHRNFPHFLPVLRSCHSGALRADLFRCAYLYIHGGVYADIDIELKERLDSFVPDGVDMVTGLAMADRKEPQHQVMITAPNNPVFLLTLQLGVWNIIHSQALLVENSGQPVLRWPVMAGIAGPPIYDLATRCYVDLSADCDVLRHSRLPRSIWTEGLYDMRGNRKLLVYKRLLDAQYVNHGRRIEIENPSVVHWKRHKALEGLPAPWSEAFTTHFPPSVSRKFSSHDRQTLAEAIVAHHRCLERDTGLHWHSQPQPLRNLYKGLTFLRRTDQKITYQIIQTFKTRDIHGRMREQALRWMAMNPEYDYRFFDDSDIRRYVQGADFSDLGVSRSQFQRALRTVDSGAGRADLFRLLIMYLEGGCYFDLDTSCRRPLRSYIQKDAVAVSGKGNYNDLHQWGLIYAPGHPFMRVALNIAVVFRVHGHPSQCLLPHSTMYVSRFERLNDLVRNFLVCSTQKGQALVQIAQWLRLRVPVQTCVSFQASVVCHNGFGQRLPIM